MPRPGGSNAWPPGRYPGVEGRVHRRVPRPSGPNGWPTGRYPGVGGRVHRRVPGPSGSNAWPPDHYMRGARRTDRFRTRILASRYAMGQPSGNQLRWLICRCLPPFMSASTIPALLRCSRPSFFSEYGPLNFDFLGRPRRREDAWCTEVSSMLGDL